MFKLYASLCVISTLIVTSWAQSSGPTAVSASATSTTAVLKDGTPLKLRVSQGTDTTALRVGDVVELEVAEAVLINEVAIIPAGSIATAVVTSQHSRIGKGDLRQVDVNLRATSLVDGERVPIRPTPQGPATETIVSNGTGQDVAVSNGAEVTAYVAGNLTIDLTKMRLAGSPTGEVRIASTPPNAEVSVDGRVVGLAPYTVRVARGEHVIALRLAGYQPWHQTVHVTQNPSDVQIQLMRQDSTESMPQPKAAAPSLGDLARQARAKRAAQDGQKSPGDATGQEAKPAPSRTLEN
jgi:hypothetical protein